MNKQTFVFTALLLCASAALQAGIDAPQVGFTRHTDGTVHSLYGMHANFIYGRQTFSLAQAASFSDQAGLLSVRGQLELLSSSGEVTATIKVNEAKPVLNVDGDATTAIAWLPTQQALALMSGDSFTLLPVGGAFSGNVTSLLRQGSAAQLFVTAPDASVSRIDIDLGSGAVTAVQPMPAATGSVFKQQSFLLFHDDAGLEVLAPDSSMRTLPLAASDLTFERLSSAWVHLHSAALNQDWALHLDSSSLELSELPAPPANSPFSRRPPLGPNSPLNSTRGVAR